MQVPDDLLYTQEHEWIRRLDGSVIRLGITDYAQDQLGDVVYVELPEVGATIAEDDILVEVESTKSVGEIYSLIAGEVKAVNASLTDSPELVNQSPYDEGWLVELVVEGELPSDKLMDAAAYGELTE